MSAVIIKDDKVSLGLLVKKDFWPAVVGYMDQLGLVYGSEKQINSEVFGECVKIRDIRGRGDTIAMLIADLTENPDKVYILLNTNKRRKRKNVRKDRKEAGAGSNG